MDNVAIQVLQMGFSLGWMFLVVMLLNCSHVVKRPILNSDKIIGEDSEATTKKIMEENKHLLLSHSLMLCT